MLHYMQHKTKSACGIEAVYMCFNGTGIWDGETITATLVADGEIF